MCVPNKTEELNIQVFNRITGKNELKILTKDILGKYKRKFDGRKCNWNHKCNNDKCWCECKKHNICEKDYIWNLENIKQSKNIYYHFASQLTN